ncbi:dual specificity protein phosphatase family protein [Streptomyces sp. TLI_171]|uniref:protein-tyrosine phosphatase family protein n=1 Tax=Streptomyces sp. TLI_171 TaxID=1938859 RepID=UPI000C1A76E9|nr:dual specificity protein phosphatase family protein [Streptomyces sp. TLI_171]RKE23354.1 dual specificity protein phosphatase-like protein [Streptomyces sp. TLI_171]
MQGPQSPWDEIVPGLWMGGHYWTDPAGELQPVVVGSEFDLVVSLYSRAGHGPEAGVEELVAEVPDGPLTSDQLGAVQQVALAAARAVGEGRTTLVRCHSGYNRSGLVVAQALVHLGQEAEEAIRLVQRQRSPWALNNDTFRDYLRSGLEIARLLTGLHG